MNFLYTYANDSTIGHLFSKATNFMNGAERKFVEIIFMKRHWEHPLKYMWINLHEMEFLLIFSVTNFVEVPKIHKIYGPWKKSALQY